MNGTSLRILTQALEDRARLPQDPFSYTDPRRLADGTYRFDHEAMGLTVDITPLAGGRVAVRYDRW